MLHTRNVPIPASLVVHNLVHSGDGCRFLNWDLGQPKEVSASAGRGMASVSVGDEVASASEIVWEGGMKGAYTLASLLFGRWAYAAVANAIGATLGTALMLALIRARGDPLVYLQAAST